MIFVFKINVKSGCMNKYIEAWKRGSSIIQKQPGAQGTRLFKKIGEKDVLIAIASWKSKALRDKAMKTLNKNPKIKEILNKHKQYGDTHILGNFNGPIALVVLKRN
jgi:heme-degrading monooxygenase HmoA